MKENTPSEKGRYSKGSIQRRVCIGTGRAIDLPPGTEAIEGIKEAGAHETDKAEENDLCAGVIEEGFGTEVGSIVTWKRRLVCVPDKARPTGITWCGTGWRVAVNLDIYVRAR